MDVTTNEKYFVISVVVLSLCLFIPDYYNDTKTVSCYVKSILKYSAYTHWYTNVYYNILF